MDRVLGRYHCLIRTKLNVKNVSQIVDKLESLDLILLYKKIR